MIWYSTTTSHATYIHYTSFILPYTSTWSTWFLVHPSGDTHVCLCMFLWGKILLLITIFRVIVKFISLVPLSFEFVCKLFFPIVGLKRGSWPILALKYPSHIFTLLFGNRSHTVDAMLVSYEKKADDRDTNPRGGYQTNNGRVVI